MGILNQEMVLAILREDNPGVSFEHLTLYAEHFLEYAKASAHIAEHGVIIAHSRTGAPIDNPYVRVRATAISALGKLRRVRQTDRVWKLLERTADGEARGDANTQKSAGATRKLGRQNTGGR